MSANRRPARRARGYAPASDAPWPPSFQPRNAQISTGPLELRAARDPELVRPSTILRRPQRAPERIARTRSSRPTRPQRASRGSSTSHQGSFVRYWISPTIICNGEQPRARSRRPARDDCAARTSQTQEQRERDPEDGGRAHMPVHGGLERPEPAERGCCPRAGRRRSQASRRRRGRRTQRRRSTRRAAPRAAATAGRGRERAPLPRARAPRRRVSTTSDNSKWLITSYGFRCDSTVERAERQPAPTRPEQDDEGQPLDELRRARRVERRSQAASVKRIVTVATIRFENSMNEW